LIRALRRAALPASRVPAAALTAFSKAEDRERALEAGFQAHLAKPIEAKTLVAAVARLAGREGLA
jgi:CheY-like chemotaxis protein